MPYLSLPVHVLRVEGFLALGEVVRRDLFVLVFEACFVTKRTFFLLRAFATPKVHLGAPLAVFCGGEVGVVLHAKQQVAHQLAINSIIPRAQLAALDGLLPRCADVTQLKRVIQVQACQLWQVRGRCRVDGVGVRARLVVVNLAAAGHGFGKLGLELWLVVPVCVVDKLLPQRWPKPFAKTVCVANPRLLGGQPSAPPLGGSFCTLFDVLSGP